MQSTLDKNALLQLVRSVFSPRPEDKNLAILIDLPDEKIEDNKDWKTRRQIAGEWICQLSKVRTILGLENTHLVCYTNVHSNNADLPKCARIVDAFPVSVYNTDYLTEDNGLISFEELLSNYQIIIALTEFSATAPLKLRAKKHRFRAATMPGFTKAMSPALHLDYVEINARVDKLKSLLDPAVGLKIHFCVDNAHSYHMHFDLRFRTAHASGGRFFEPGTAGNLPSGECYIVPYEGERKEISQSNGILPVQFDREIVLYQIKNNKAVNVLSQGSISKQELEHIKQEPAYSNIAEIGFGILKDFGILPIGEVLLDEKLGLHIAFGRSDHFGGAIGVHNFSSPENVIHIDRIYLPETMDRIAVKTVQLQYRDGSQNQLMEDGIYTIF